MARVCPSAALAVRLCFASPVMPRVAPRRLRRQSLWNLTLVLGSVSHQDRFIFGAVLLGVEQHEVAARGAFDPDGKGQMIIVILAQGEIVTAGRPAVEKECGEAPDAQRVRRAADRTSRQAKLRKCLGDLDNETLSPSHTPLYLRPTHARARRRV
jgi:hypothetical protein